MALLLLSLVIGAAWACGGSTDTPNPTATTAPAEAPDPTETPADTEEPDAAPPATSTRDWNVLGSRDALVTVLEYNDFQCPSCRRWALGTAQEIRSAYLDDGRVKMEYRHYAVVGADSPIMAQGAECAGEQGAFWEYHDSVFQNRTGVQGRTGVKVRGGSLVLDRPQFNACMDNGTYRHIVDGDLAQAKEYGVTTEPTIFILSGDQMTKFVGAPAFDVVSAVIDEYLDTAY